MLLLLTNFIQQVSCNFTIVIHDQNSKPPIISFLFPWILVILCFIIVAYLLIIFFISCCCCTPESIEDPSLCITIFFFVSSLVILLSTILHFVGLKKIKNKGYYDNEWSSMLLSKNISIHITNDKIDFVKHVQKFKAFNKNITETDRYYQKLAKFLNIKIIEYNNAFVKSNEQYRISFNKIYFNPNTNNHMKSTLKKMDESRNNMFSDIISFSKDYDQFSKYLQNTLTKINEDILISSEKLNKKTTNEEEEYFHEVIMHSFAMTTTVFSLIVAVICPIFNFFNFSVSRISFCIMPLIEIAILVFVFASRLTLHKYESAVNFCNSHIYTFNNNIFPELNFKEIERLIEKVDSKSLHNNFLSIESTYINNKEYNEELSRMIQVIRNKDKDLHSIKTILENIKNFEYSTYLTIHKIERKTDLLKNQIKTKSHYDEDESYCNEMILGCNIAMFGTFFLFIGFIMMSIAVFIRRKTMDEYIPVSNNYRSSSGSGGGSYSHHVFYEGKKTMYYVIYLNDPKNATEEDYIPLINFGSQNGFFCFINTNYAINFFIDTQYKSYMNLNHIVEVTCTVDLGNCLSTNEYQFGPNYLEKYNCNSSQLHFYHYTLYCTFDRSQTVAHSYETVNMDSFFYQLREMGKF